MKHMRTLLMGLLIPTAILVTSCTKREDMKVAEFKDKSITIGEFERAYSRVDPVYLPRATGFEGKKEFLTTMLNKEVMAYKADELGYDKDPSVVNGLDAFKKLGLQAGYLKRRVADKVTVSEEDVRRHYANRGGNCAVKQMLLDTPSQADEVYEMLEDGGDFDTILKNYSKAPDASQGGSVTTISYGNYAPSLQWEVFQLEVGEYTEPIYTPYGFFIIKVLRRDETRKTQSFEDMRETLELEVRATKEMIAINKYTDGLRDRYGIEWYWDNFYTVLGSLPPDRPLTNPPRRQDEVYPLLFFDEGDMDLPLVTYKGKTIAIKDFSDMYDQASFFTRPRREYRLGAIKSFLTEHIMNELVVEEMRNSGIENDPEVSRAIRAKEEEMMINRLYEEMVNQQTTVTTAMIQDYYNANTEAFIVPEKRRFGVILCGDHESATRAYQEIQGGALFRNVAMAYTIDDATRRKLAETELLSMGEQPEMDRVGFALPSVGAVSEPFETSRGWMILKLIEQTERKAFAVEEARGTIESVLKQQLNEERLNELLTEWKEDLGVVINEDNLKKVQIDERSAATELEAGA